jgi:hypothetical protein
VRGVSRAVTIGYCAVSVRGRIRRVNTQADKVKLINFFNLEDRGQSPALWSCILDGFLVKNLKILMLLHYYLDLTETV